MNSRLAPAGLISPFWLRFAACFLALCWLLPNHTPPWSGFHADAWCALILLLIALFVMIRAGGALHWHAISLLSLGLALTPLLQYATGQVYFFGTAWISALYLFGFVLALQIGGCWERRAPGELGDFIFAAMVLAGLVSVAMQINQWQFRLPLGAWLMLGQGSRFYANLMQANQLGSLLVLGVLGLFWMHLRWRLPGLLAWALAAFLLLGVALTESRTAILNLVLLFGMVLVWRKSLPSNKYLLAMGGLLLVYLAWVLALPWLSPQQEVGAVVADRGASVSLRLTAWQMFLEASLQQPWLGMGWGEHAATQFMMQANYPAMGGMFLKSHNLALDFILWLGYPLALVVLIGIGRWVWVGARSIVSTEQLILFAFLMVLGVHSMLEFPLHYAYFLLPAGLVLGTLNHSFGMKVLFVSGRWSALTLFVIAALGWTITAMDYFKIETSFYGLRFDHRKIKNSISKTPPEVLVLDQWREHLRLARNPPTTNASASDLAHMQQVVEAVPSALVLQRYAANLALSGRVEEAERWRVAMCKAVAKTACDQMREGWDALLAEGRAGSSAGQ